MKRDVPYEKMDRYRRGVSQALRMAFSSSLKTLQRNTPSLKREHLQEFYASTDEDYGPGQHLHVLSVRYRIPGKVSGQAEVCFLPSYETAVGVAEKLNELQENWLYRNRTRIEVTARLLDTPNPFTS